MEVGIIYKITNLITNKYYIGQTRSKLSHRISQHKYSAKNGCKFDLHKSIRKYGWENFKWEIICKCNTDDELNEKEIFYINKNNSLKPNGYNMTLNKYGFLGTDLSGENNPRYDDHRTWEEIHGKERADKLKVEAKATFTDERKAEIAKLSRKRFIENNPMDNPKHRETLSKMRMGGNNPNALYEWIFILPSGIIYNTDCLREFCRKTGFKRNILTNIANVKNYISKDDFYKGWKCIKTKKER